MSAFDSFKKLFSQRAANAAKESRLSLGNPDESLSASTLQTPAPEPGARAKARASTQFPTPELLTLPFLGQRTLAQHQRWLGLSLGISLLVLAGVTVFALSQSSRLATHLGVLAQALTQSQRLAKSANQALAGNGPALAEVAESTELLATAGRSLRDAEGSLQLGAAGLGLGPELQKLEALLERTDKSARAVLAQQQALKDLGVAARQAHAGSARLLERAQQVFHAKLQQGASASELSAASQLALASQRVGALAGQLLLQDPLVPDAAAQLSKNWDSLNEQAQSLLQASAKDRDGSAREALEQLLKTLEETRTQGGALLAHLAPIGAARQAHTALVADSEPLRLSLERVQSSLSAQAGVGLAATLVLVLAAVVAMLSAAGLSYVQLQDSRRRQQAAEAQRQRAVQQELEAKRINDANQAAILRLMNELQSVAEGDLTQEATVTEDITGAIADSVNYTVEELRNLVSQVQSTAAQVAQTTGEVDATSTELLAASKEQLHEIRETGQSVLEMAGRITNVSAQAQESARVARQSLMAAETGFMAVQNTIGGMNTLRDQIQDTAKRIKRLGESSQEIGEITELISDITEQTNVLALNAAIQAASAGEAGRGFSVVAEEVQRLAERSADATRQIASLVKAIQTDTQDAIGAMERSTQGVVEGARLSDNAGMALTEIDRVSRRVADLIEQISDAASREASLASTVAENIQHIFAVTEQTGDGTRVTAGQVRELSRMAEALRQSVQRFKIV